MAQNDTIFQQILVDLPIELASMFLRTRVEYSGSISESEALVNAGIKAVRDIDREGSCIAAG